MDSFSFWEQYTASCREMMGCMMEQTVKQSDNFQRQMLNAWQTSPTTEQQADEVPDGDPPDVERPRPACSEPV